MGQFINDENVDPFNDSYKGSQYYKNVNSIRSRPNTSSMVPTLRRGNHHSKAISPLKPMNQKSSFRSRANSRANSMSSSYIQRPSSQKLYRSKSNITITSTPFNSPRKSITSTATKNEPNNKTTVVVIGDSKCGKTKLVLNYLKASTSLNAGKLQEKVNLFETYEIDIFIRNLQKTINMQIWDFPGDEMFDRFRPISYISSNFVLICFNFNYNDYRVSLNNIKERWIPEVETHCDSNVTKFIIGIDRNLKGYKQSSNLPNFSYFYKLAKSLNCKYLECSLNDLNSIEKIFDILATLKANQENEELFKKARLNGKYLNNNSNHASNSNSNSYLNNDILYLDDNQSKEYLDQDELLPSTVGYRKTSYSKKRHACTIT